MMKSGLLKHLFIAFAVALVGYVLLFWGYEHLRTRKGPWEVVFESTQGNSPTVIISQKSLAVSGVTLVFEGEQWEEPVPARTVSFDDPKRPVPLGELLFHDLMFLPGTITLSLFEHEVELLPRVLIIDRKEYPWESGRTFILPGIESTAPPTEAVSDGSGASGSDKSP